MENGVVRGSGGAGAGARDASDANDTNDTGAAAQRLRAIDALGAIALAEGAVAEHVLNALGEEVPLPPRNAFGEPVVVERGSDIRALAARATELASGGKRVALIARARLLTSARDLLEEIAVQRLGVVVHAVADAGAGDALALADIGWGALFSGGVLDSMDLALIARRAAEDCGTPFFVIHERGAVRFTEPVVGPTRELCETYVGAPTSRIRRKTDAAHPANTAVGARSFSERVPFALGSAMRELEALTSRRHDMFERYPAGDASLVLLGLGRLGEPLVAEVDRLRAAGHDVGALRLTAFRPFPGPRLVKALARAIGVTVLESDDLPLAQSNAVTREVKSAFADALTWAPDYPGVGRIPRIFSGVLGRGAEVDSADVDACVENMHSDERGKRIFALAHDEPHTLPKTTPVPSGNPPLAFRGRVRDPATASICSDVCAAVIASVTGLRVRAAVRELSRAEGEGFVFDIVASRDRPRGAHVPHALRIIALDDASALVRGNPITRLAGRGVVAVPTVQRTPDALWAEIPPYARAIVHDRRARVVGWAPPSVDGESAADGKWSLAAAFAGLAVSGASAEGRAAYDPSLVAREVFQVLVHMPGGPSEPVATRAAEAGRRAFEAAVEVPRALIDRDDEAVRLGRRDARASVPPR